MAEQTLIVLIRGINVGTAKQVGMGPLREALARVGYPGARTHLRSGNLLLTTDRAAGSVAADVEDVLAGPLGVPATVVVRSVDQLRRAVAADPFGDEAPDGAKHFLGFLDGRPTAAVRRDVEAMEVSPDRVALVDDHLYLWCPQGISKGPLSRVDWNRRLGVTTTVRNWNTVTALLQLADRP